MPGVGDEAVIASRLSASFQFAATSDALLLSCRPMLNAAVRCGIQLMFDPLPGPLVLGENTIALRSSRLPSIYQVRAP